MEDLDACGIEPEKRAEYRAQRAARRRKKKRAALSRRVKRILPVFVAVIAVGLILAGTKAARGEEQQAAAAAIAPLIAAADAPETSSAQPEEPEIYSAAETPETVRLGADFSSGYAILIDLNTGSILAEKEAATEISPASMTKILTALVAAEHVENLDDPVTITSEITGECYRNDCSVVGFAPEESVPVRDLFYGTILPSGADAALALADYTAGSQEAFVELMNQKLEELGLSATAHFTNCVGLYDPNHYCTVYDMAMILKAAMENDLCRQALSAHTYTTAATAEHPDGLLISNWFLRRIEDKDTGGLDVLYAKTGYVAQSGCCAASYAAGDGKAYLCVTGDAYSSWRCIYDHVALYQRFGKSS